MNIKHATHANHAVHINWALRNAHGNPALCCSECVTPRGARRGQPAYIDWVKRDAIPHLVEMGVPQRFSHIS